MNNIVYRELGVKTNTGFKRNIIITREENIDTFRTQHKNTDVYATVYFYDKEDIRDAKQQGPLYFDFDGETAQEDIKAVIQFLLKQDCPKESIRVFFSGNKGFHLEIPFNAFGIALHKQLNVVNEIIAKELAQKTHSVSIDLKIYDNVRLWRLVNSINSKSGLYKIPLYLKELELPLDEIKRIAVAPRDNFEYPQTVVWDKFNSIFKVVSSIKKNTLQYNTFQPVEEGERNNIMFKRALFLKAKGKTQEQALEICLSIQDNPPLPSNEIERTVRSAYNDKYVVQNFGNRDYKSDEINTSFYEASDGALCEQIYDDSVQESFFLVYKNGKFERKSFYKDGDQIVKPITDKIVKEKYVKLPSGVIEYSDELELVSKIRLFIHKYVDIPILFEQWTAYYVLLTWVYDKLPVCPYLCALGPSDAGKTRLIQTIGAVCYKPFTASGSATASPIFRIVDKFRGTLILNEFDHIGDYNSEIVVIMNNGFEKGLPVIRTEGDKEKDVRVYHVYGPKLFSSRKRKNDWAFETRVITVPMKETNRKDIPSFLMEQFEEEAEELRNMLLYFRFKHFKEEIKLNNDQFPKIKGRLKQSLLSLTSVIKDKQFLQTANEFAIEMEKELKILKGFDIDAAVYKELRDFWLLGDHKPEIKVITQRVKEVLGMPDLKPKTVGGVIRDELGFETRRGGSNGNYVVILTQAKIEYLKDKYEITNIDTEPTEQAEQYKEDEQLDLVDSDKV